MDKNLRPLISVLVPVYNTHKYLDDCLTSIKNQTYSNLEIICIDDGSTDGSLEILKKFAVEDSRFKIFTQENHGLGYTRNVLIPKVKGEYFAFVDSDDTILEDYIEKLYNAAKETNADIVRCDYWEFYNGERRKGDKLKKGTVDIPNKISKRILAGYHYPMACMRLIKTSFMRDTKIKCCEIGVCEDLSFSMLLFIFANKIITIPDCLYIYRKDNESAITASQNRDKILLGRLGNIIYVFEELKKLNKIDKSVADLLTRLLLHHISTLRKLGNGMQQKAITDFNRAVDVLKQLKGYNVWYKRFLYSIILFLLAHLHGKIKFVSCKLFLFLF